MVEEGILRKRLLARQRASRLPPYTDRLADFKKVQLSVFDHLTRVDQHLMCETSLQQVPPSHEASTEIYARERKNLHQSHLNILEGLEMLFKSNLLPQNMVSPLQDEVARALGRLKNPLWSMRKKNALALQARALLANHLSQ